VGLDADLMALHEKSLKHGEGGLHIVRALIKLALAPKSRISAQMLLTNISDHHPRLEIPDEAFDKHTRKGRQMGRGTEHFLKEAAKVVTEPQPTAELERIEDEYVALRWAIVEEDPGLPDNPWRSLDDWSGKAANTSWLPADDNKDGQASFDLTPPDEEEK
jgi:hypothetical protein